MGDALKNTFVPEAGVTNLFPAILTLMGGTVGGYITFAGAHRLIDAGITGEKNLKEINKSSVMGMVIASIVRIFLFLAVLGVVVKSADPRGQPIRQQQPSKKVQEKSDTALQVWCFSVQLLPPSSVPLTPPYPS